MGAFVRGSGGPTANFINEFLHPQEQLGKAGKVVPGRVARKVVRLLPLGRDPNKGKGKNEVRDKVGSRSLGILKFAIDDRAKLCVAKEVATGSCVPHELWPESERATLASGTTASPDVLAAILISREVKADIGVRGSVEDRGTY
jgi:hypothetical protein